MPSNERKAQLFRLITRAVIVVTVAVVAFGVWRTITAGTSAGIRPGDTVALPDIDFAGAPRTVLVFVSSNCRYCTESMPFYRRLTGLRKAPIIVVGYQPADVLRAYVNSQGVFPDAVVSATPSTLAVSGSPTVIIVDSSRRVVAVWRGLLRARESEVEVGLS